MTELLHLVHGRGVRTADVQFPSFSIFAVWNATTECSIPYCYLHDISAGAN